MNDPRVQAMFKRSTFTYLSFFIISQDYYKLSKRTLRDNGNICHTIKTNDFRDVQSLHQGKASMDLNLSELKLLTST